MIHIIIGTRAEAIKMAPVILALKKHGAEYKIVGTGQHRVEEILSNFGIDDLVEYIISPPEKGTVSRASVARGVAFSINVMRRIHKHSAEGRPKWVLYHGDTMTTATTAVGTNAVLGKQWKTGHVESGLRSRSPWEPFPEEISRIVADHLSDVLFAPTEWAAENLRREGIDKKIIVTGNTSVDAVRIALRKAEKIDIPWDKYILVNVHRFENIKPRKRIRAIVKTVLEVANIFDGKIIWPMHSTTERMLRKYKLLDKLKSRVEISESLPYLQFVRALSQARAVLTDGGSIQEESVTLRVPAVILRNKTERPEGLKTPYNYLVGTDTERIVETVKRVIEKPPKWNGENPYGDGKAGERIARIVEDK